MQAKAALLRLTSDLREIQNNPLTQVAALPLEENMLEWHCNFLGPEKTEMEGVVFHVILYFPNDYPVKSPSCEFLPDFAFSGAATRRGKKGGASICLSIFSDFAQVHTEWASEKGTGWSPSYTVLTVLLNLVSFLYESVSGRGYYGYSGANNEKIIRETKSFKCTDCGHTHDVPYPPFPSKIVNTPPPPSSLIVCYVTKEIFVDPGKKVEKTETKSESSSSAKKETESDKKVVEKVSESVKLQDNNDNNDDEGDDNTSESNEDVTAPKKSRRRRKGKGKQPQQQQQQQQQQPQPNEHQPPKEQQPQAKEQPKEQPSEKPVQKKPEKSNNNNNSKQSEKSPPEKEKDSGENWEVVKTKGKEKAVPSVESKVEPKVITPYIGNLFGFGISKTVAGKNVQFTSPCEWLTNVAFDLLKTNGGKAESVMREEIHFWLPMFINESHGDSIKLAFEKCISELAGIAFNPLQVLEYLPRLLNNTVVNYMNGSTHTSERSLQGYFCFYRLFLWAIQTYPILQSKVDKTISNFIFDPTTRLKQNTPNIGEWLTLLLVASDNDNLTWQAASFSYLKENFTRNVMWTLKDAPQLNDVSPSSKANATRVNVTFEKTKVSRDLLAFQVSFLDIARPKGMSRKEAADRLDERNGLPSLEMEQQLILACNNIKKISNYPQWYRAIKVNPPASEKHMLDFLIESVKTASTLEGYYFRNPDSGFGRGSGRGRGR